MKKMNEAMCQCNTVKEVIELFVKELQECWHIEEEVAAATEECISCIEALMDEAKEKASDDGAGEMFEKMQRALDRL